MSQGRSSDSFPPQRLPGLTTSGQECAKLSARDRNSQQRVLSPIFTAFPFVLPGRRIPEKTLRDEITKKIGNGRFFHDSFGAMRLSTVQQLMGTGSCKTGRMRRRSERGSNRRTGGPFPVVRQEGLLCFAGSDVLAAVVEAKCAVRGVKASSAFRIGIRRLCTLDSPLCTAGRGPVSFPVRSGLLRSHSRLRARGYKKETAISISRRLVPAFLFLLRRRVPTVFLRVCLRSPPPEPAPCPAGSCCRIRSPVRTAA